MHSRGGEGGNAQRREKIRSGYLTTTFSGVERGQKGYVTAAFSGLPSAKREDKISTGPKMATSHTCKYFM